VQEALSAAAFMALTEPQEWVKFSTKGDFERKEVSSRMRGPLPSFHVYRFYIQRDVNLALNFRCMSPRISRIFVGKR